MVTRSREETLARAAADALAEAKGKNIVLLDLSKVSSFADYFVIGTGESQVQMSALSRKVRETMIQNEAKSLNSSGSDSDSWILLDYGTVIIHIFSQKARNYYALEEFWGDAGIIHWTEEETAQHEVRAYP